MAINNFPAKLLEDLETQSLVELEETKKALFELVASSEYPAQRFVIDD